jgi:pimeloyl-ACP methyl ester carboxylesterase
VTRFLTNVTNHDRADDCVLQIRPCTFSLVRKPMKISARLGRTLAVTALALTGIVGVTAPGAAGGPPPVAAHPSWTKPTVVLVHGAWADGSSWAGVTQRLQDSGFTVDVLANPLRGVDDDAKYVANFLSNVPGPVVLVGHSYGGMVITNAATGLSNVKALVYIDAYVPDQGDTVTQLTTAKPGAALAVPDPRTVFDIVPFADGTGADLYVKQALFPGFFAAGAPARQAAVLAAGQRPLSAGALDEPSPDVPAWKSIPSWDLIGTADKIIPPAEQEVMAARAGAHTVRVKAPHLSMVTRPDAVTNLITTAAHATR